MKAELFPPIPSDTAKTARAVFGKSNFYIVTGDQANSLFSGLILVDSNKQVQRPARTLALFYLIMIFQFLETLPDNQAADALRQRVDWKYALHLPLNHSGFQAATFCEFRKWLLVDRTSEHHLQTLLSRLSEVVLSTNRQSLNLDADQIVARVCMFSRLERIWEAFSLAVEALAIKRPDRLRAISLPHWYERYSRQRNNLNLRAEPSEQERLAQSIGADGFYLLEAIANIDGLADLPEVSTLSQVWQDQYELVEGKVLWRNEACANCSLATRLWDPLEQVHPI